MASRATFQLVTATTSVLFLLLLLHGSPAGAEYVNVTEILERGGQYNKFLLYLWDTVAGHQIDDYLNKSNNVTLFAPTDNAINKLEDGFFNRFTSAQQIEFLLYHFVPYFFTWDNFRRTAINPVMTKAGGVYKLDFIFGEGQQVNISTGLVTVPINHQLNVTFPLAVYSIETALQHPDLFGPPESPPSSPSAPSPVPGGPATNDTVPTRSQAPPADASEPSQSTVDDKNASFQMKATWWSRLIMAGVVCFWVVSS